MITFTVFGFFATTVIQTSCFALRPVSLQCDAARRALEKSLFYDCEGLGLQWSRSNKRAPFLFWNKSEVFCDKMAHTVISVNLPPHIDPTKSRIAYGDRALPKLVSCDYFILK